MLAGENTEGSRLATQALVKAEELGLEELRAHALITIGTAKFWQGEEGGESDLEKALEIALAVNSPVAATALNNLGVLASASDVRREHALIERCYQVAERMGDRETMRFTQGNLVTDLVLVGRWDEGLELADEFIAACEAGSPHNLDYFVRETRAIVRLARGEIDAALEDQRRAREITSDHPDARQRMEPIGQSAVAYALIGRTKEARRFAEDFADGVSEVAHQFQYRLLLVSLFADELGIAAWMRRVAEAGVPSGFRNAAAAALDGDFVRAADILAALGTPTGEADARLRAAERLVAAGRHAEGAAQLEQALAFHRSVEATFYVERGEALVTKTA